MVTLNLEATSAVLCFFCVSLPVFFEMTHLSSKASYIFYLCLFVKYFLLLVLPLVLPWAVVVSISSWSDPVTTAQLTSAFTCHKTMIKFSAYLDYHLKVPAHFLPRQCALPQRRHQCLHLQICHWVGIHIYLSNFAKIFRSAINTYSHI